ncbi:Tripeptidyl-peptidase sed1 [Lachnellula arida]|uniref:Tripeptidyl-peptidase sed1 n=1 Tax=Lachnellula arida TaxID=1316785 RepID=A0A8T9BAN3_9HELO|nr:Tripeptidyl-peptidase sed1 [Lachnellula arida]
MKLTVLAIVGGFVAQALAAPAPVPYVLHEKREVQTGKWTRNLDVKLNRDAVIPISIGLTQRNLENGYDLLMDVSHPESPNYGKHWSMQKIKETFAPSAETVSSVKSWLAESGIHDSRVKFSKSLGWAKFNATVEEVEYLLRTEYYAYTNAETGNDHLACEDYSVPTHLKEHIDFVTPTIHFDALVKPTKKRRDLEKRSMRVRPTPQIKKGSDIVPGPEFSPEATQYTLANCYEYVTPQCIRALYNFTNGTLALSSYGVVEYTPQAYLQTDLNLFYTNLAREIPSGTKPKVNLIDGATVQTTTQSFDDNGESDLDIQYAIALVYPQKVTLYQTGDSVEGASFNNFLDAIDAAYCTSGGGDDPSQDGIYPDTASGGYKGAEGCGNYTAASVISTSYGYNEADLTAAYETRQCNEYMKLGLAGTTFLYSSGDYGVAGNSATAPEEACQTVIYSGGGFSNVFAMPSYQSSAVASYFSSHKPSYTATQYNNSQAVRGYPDVSANGANYVVAVDGSLSLVYGTSASSPTFGSVITLINEQRIHANKSAVGFINPTVYANPSAFNDITSGGNEGCGTDGFTAVEGWDPVTGLGTPNYPKLLAVFMALS